MGKINYSELKQLLDSGNSQADCSRHFQVSEAAISKAVRRLQAMELPDSFKRLTDKKKAYVLNRIEGKSKTASAMEAFDCSTLDSARLLVTL